GHGDGRAYDRCGYRESTCLNPQNFAITIGKPGASGRPRGHTSWAHPALEQWGRRGPWQPSEAPQAPRLWTGWGRTLAAPPHAGRLGIAVQSCLAQDTSWPHRAAPLGIGHEGIRWWACRCQQPYLLALERSGQRWFTKNAEEPGGRGGVCVQHLEGQRTPPWWPRRYA